jgi:hypothetical protein
MIFEENSAAAPRCKRNFDKKRLWRTKNDYKSAFYEKNAYSFFPPPATPGTPQPNAAGNNETPASCRSPYCAGRFLAPAMRVLMRRAIASPIRVQIRRIRDEYPGPWMKTRYNSAVLSI